MFRGEYLQINPSGLNNRYQFGDTVLFEGNIYIALKETEFSPYQDPIAWKYTGKNSIFFSDQPPINPQEGQQWENNGVIYTYYYDGDKFTWVQF